MDRATEVTETKSNGEVRHSEGSRMQRPDSVLRPPVDVYETDEGITLQADMPGVSKERLDLRVDGNTLLVEGTIGISPQEHMSALYADVRSTLYRRSFVLSNEL